MSRRSAGVGMASFIFSPTTFPRSCSNPCKLPTSSDGCERTGQRGGDHAFAGSHGHGWYDLGLLAHTCGTRPTLATVAAPVCRLPRPDGAEGRVFWRQAKNSSSGPTRMRDQWSSVSSFAAFGVGAKNGAGWRSGEGARMISVVR
jgi:hypothetical protein